MEPRNVLVLVTPAYQPRLAGIARYARQHGWRLTILDRISRSPRGWNGDGVLVTLREDSAALAFVKAVRRRRIPVVDLTFNHPELRLPRVSGDHFAMGQLARRHFEERNFRSFAWFSTGWLNVHRLRYDGFATPATPKSNNQTIEQSNNSPAVPRWIFSKEAPEEQLDDFAYFDRWFAAKLKSVGKPLALLCYDDADAARALGATLAAGYAVPGDVAILGIGGDRLICENQAVRLSSIEHDQGRTGYEGAEMLDRLMSGGSPSARERTILIPPRGLTVRASTDVVASRSPLMRRALKLIAENLTRPFGLAQLTDELGVSRATVNRLFAAELGRSVGEEILRERLDRAKLLLSTTERTVKTVAEECGFCNQGYLTNAFRREFGLTPKSYRRQGSKP